MKLAYVSSVGIIITLVVKNSAASFCLTAAVYIIDNMTVECAADKTLHFAKLVRRGHSIQPLRYYNSLQSKSYECVGAQGH